MRLLVVDTETGGLTPEYSLLSLYAKVVDTAANWRTVGELELFLKPEDGKYILHPKALSTNKIQILEHDKKAVSYHNGTVQLLDLVRRASQNGHKKIVFHGKNVSFDWSFVNHYLIPEEMLHEYIHHRKFDLDGLIYTRVLENKLKDQSWSLSALASHLGIDSSNAHDAKADVEMTVNITKRLLEM